MAIARALASEAKVLLADEPTGNLDETTTGEIIELLKQTAHELGKCVIVVTHSREVAQAGSHFETGSWNSDIKYQQKERPLMTKENPNTIPSNYIPGQDPLDDYIAEQLKAAADSIPLSDDVKCRVEQKLSNLKMQESKNERI